MCQAFLPGLPSLTNYTRNVISFIIIFCKCRHHLFLYGAGLKYKFLFLTCISFIILPLRYIRQRASEPEPNNFSRRKIRHQTFTLLGALTPKVLYRPGIGFFLLKFTGIFENEIKIYLTFP
jgi:hypothetical protein